MIKTIIKKVNHKPSHLYKSLFLLFLLSLGFHQSTQAQSKKNRKKVSVIVVLNDGTLLKGDYLKRAKQDSICLKMFDGTELKFNFNEVKEIKNEQRPGFLSENFAIKKRGYYNVSQLGFLIGSTSWNPVTITMHSINGYQIFPQLAVGIGLGFDNYDDSIFTPIYLDLRGDVFSKTRTTPFYYGGLGYGIWLNGNNTDWRSNEGGLHYNFGIGIRRRGMGYNNWVLSVGQQTQQARTTVWWNNETEVTRLFLNRLVIKTGISF